MLDLEKHVIKSSELHFLKHYQVFLCKCTNLGISSRNFLTFSSNPLPQSYKLQGHTQCQFQIIELEPRTLKKIGFSGQILIKLRL